MNNDQGKRYTYREAGFNRFFRRSLGSNAAANTLNGTVKGTTRQLNLDDAQVSGSLGDVLRVGRITLDGKLGRQSVHDALGTEVLRLGELDDG